MSVAEVVVESLRRFADLSLLGAFGRLARGLTGQRLLPCGLFLGALARLFLPPCGRPLRTLGLSPRADGLPFALALGAAGVALRRRVA